MIINVQYVKMPTSPAMTDYVSMRLGRLGRKYPWLISAEVYFKFENNSRGRGKICEINLSLPGPNIFASAEGENYEVGVAKTIRELERMCEKKKGMFLSGV